MSPFYRNGGSERSGCVLAGVQLGSGTGRLEPGCAGSKACVVGLCTGPPRDRFRLTFTPQLCLPSGRGLVFHASWASGSSAGTVTP